MPGIRCFRSTDFSAQLESVLGKDRQETVTSDADMGTVSVELVPDLPTADAWIAGTHITGKLDDDVLFQKLTVLEAFMLIIGLLRFPKQRTKLGYGAFRRLCCK